MCFWQTRVRLRAGNAAGYNDSLRCLSSSFVINTLLRRILHAVLFEVCALVILVPLMSYGFGMDMLHFGALALILAVCAMASNMIYNHFYEMVEHRYGWRRTVPMRVLHTLGFEAFFMALALPLTAWWLDIGIVDALLLDVTFSIFFMIYAFCFNWVFDIARHRLAGWQAARR